LLVSEVGTGFSQVCLYFPRCELIVVLHKLPWKESLFDCFKAYAVTNCKKLKKYLNNCDRPKKAILIDCPHFAHHLWNELSGLYKIYEADLLSKIDFFLTLDEPIGQIDDIFPEIPQEKIRRIKRIELTEEILENNYFVIRAGLNYIKQDLAERIDKASRKYCSFSFLEEVEKAKQDCFPLLWVSIRTNNRTWISQTEGIANIIKKLSEKFPNFGIVIDGFSIPYGTLDKSWTKATIEEQKQVVKNIQELVNPKIKIYNTVGCEMYESIVWSEAVDLYIAHHGSIQHKIGWIANKPGIVHANKQVLKHDWHPTFWARENSVAPLYISERYITDVSKNVQKNKEEKRMDLNNYDCDWRVIFKEVFKLASSISRQP
jgi:hypothetical protein